MEQNKALCPPWNLCNYMADLALQDDNGKLAYHALEFMAKWILRGEQARPPVLLYVDEGLLVSTLGIAGRTYDTSLLTTSWQILKRSMRQKAPNPEAYIAKIYALSSLGELERAFTTLNEFESAYKNTTYNKVNEELLSPFTSLSPLVNACSKRGFETLDAVCFSIF